MQKWYQSICKYKNNNKTNYQMTFTTIIILLTLPIIKQGSFNIIHSNVNQHSAFNILQDVSSCDAILKGKGTGVV